ncbi:MAG: ATP-binding cassette, subfamily bacterial [Solirubrobacteraceae bacterium]|jgi:ATP-binding cassette subfamily B protein|nr:transporter ATP-binding protein [Solirubrobacterales bacterium]MEA2217056.1 ATP-binding cassette, subfamily bacterial [Solirubrobacteraceae bacterium]
MSTFYRLLGFLRPYRRGVVVSSALACAAMVMTVLVPYLTGLAVEAIKHGATHGRLHELALRAHDRHTLLVVALVIAGAVLVRWGLTYLRRMVAGRISLGIEYDLREMLYAHLQRLELGFFDRQQTGQLMSRATVDLQAVRFFLGYGLVFILQAGLTIVLAGIAMIAINPKLGLIAMAPVPFVVLISQRYGHSARPAIQEIQQRIAELTADAEENISGVRVVKSFARESHQLERFRHSVARVFDQSMVATRLEATYNPVIGFLPQLGLAAVLLIGGEAVIHQHLSLGQFAQFYLYLNMLIGPMRSLGVTLGLAQRATASGARIFQVLDREPRIVQAPEPTPLPPGNGHVELRGVTLRYDETDDFGATYSAPREGSGLDAAIAAADGHGEHPALGEPAANGASANGSAHQSRAALTGIDLDVPAGTTVALVGGTGSGKTSLVSLISRLYDTSEGHVLLDGADVRDVEVRPLRRAVSIVSDDPFLFSATVAENIAYGRPEASREEIEAAARKAQAHGFVSELPQGYETRVGERGLSLSGGQRQRIAIARALVADPRVLILDDATSSVDASTEQSIKLALDAAMAGRTTFVIAHRLSTISLADEIVVLDHGRIIAHGDHEELLEASELYREIVEKGLPDQVFMTRKPLEPEVSGL